MALFEAPHAGPVSAPSDTCGVGGAVMGIIGLIEGIIYLVKSDEDFYQEYMVEKKGWF